MAGSRLIVGYLEASQSLMNHEFGRVAPYASMPVNSSLTLLQSEGSKHRTWLSGDGFLLTISLNYQKDLAFMAESRFSLSFKSMGTNSMIFAGPLTSTFQGKPARRLFCYKQPDAWP
jgi:hypothetical protein